MLMFDYLKPTCLMLHIMKLCTCKRVSRIFKRLILSTPIHIGIHYFFILIKQHVLIRNIHNILIFKNLSNFSLGNDFMSSSWWCVFFPTSDYWFKLPQLQVFSSTKQWANKKHPLLPALVMRIKCSNISKGRFTQTCPSGIPNVQ